MSIGAVRRLAVLAAGALLAAGIKGGMMTTLAKWGTGIIAGFIGLALVVFVLENVAAPRVEEGYGEGQEEMEDAGGADRTPQWASDGKTLVLNVGQRVIAVSAAGDKLWNVAGDEEESDSSSAYYSPSISPNGRVAYQNSKYETGLFGLGSREYKRYVETANLYGSEVARIHGVSNDSISPLIPAWSPDGSHLAFIMETVSRRLTDSGHDAERERDLVVVDKDSNISASFRIPGLDGYYLIAEAIMSAPIWSNNGQRIAFISAGVEGTSLSVQRIWTINKDGSGQIPVAETGDYNEINERLSLPGWSPTDERLYYVQSYTTAEASRSVLYSVKSDGSDTQTIAEIGDDLFITNVKSSPNGDKLLLVGSHGIYVVGIDGTELTPIRGRYASWSPNGDSIAVYGGYGSHPFFDALYSVAPDGSDSKTLIRIGGNSITLFYGQPLPDADQPLLISSNFQ